MKIYQASLFLKLYRRILFLPLQFRNLPASLSTHLFSFAWVILKKPKLPRVVVAIHVYWPEELDFIITFLQKFSIPIHLLITNSKPDILFHIQTKLSILPPNITVIYRTVENKGRDFFPLFSLVDEIKNIDADYIIKLHTKKSQPRWFRILVKSLLRSEWRLRIFQVIFERHPESVIGHPLLFYPSKMINFDEPAWQRLAKILVTNNYEIPISWYFPAGSMFAISKNHLIEVFDEAKNINLLHFETEADYSQSSSAHLLERFFGINSYFKGSKCIATSLLDFFQLNALLVKIK